MVKSDGFLLPLHVQIHVNPDVSLVKSTFNPTLNLIETLNLTLSLILSLNLNMFVDRNSHKRVFVRQVVAKSNHHGKDGESEAHINGRSRSIQTALPVYYIWTCTRIITQRRPAALAHT